MSPWAILAVSQSRNGTKGWNCGGQMGAKLEPKLKRAGDQFYPFLPMGRQGCLSSAKGGKKVQKALPKVPKMT